MLTWTKMQNPRDGVKAEFVIEDDEVDGSSFTIELVDMGRDVIAPRVVFFDDAFPTLGAFVLHGGAKALNWEGKTSAGFIAAMTNVGIARA